MKHRKLKKITLLFHHQIHVIFLSAESGEALLGFTVQVGSGRGAQVLTEELVGLDPVEGLGLHRLVVTFNSWVGPGLGYS